jgi:uncharacterized cupredoxin-like copper-binding protein
MTRDGIAVGSALALGAGIVAAALATAGHDPTSPAAAAPAPGHVVRVVERDFRITLDRRTIRRGAVVFRVDNRGPDAHELIVVRAAHGLPLRSDGITVDEDAVERQTVGVLEPGAAGGVRSIHATLVPGRYVLLCNMYGHFMGGMETSLEVR